FISMEVASVLAPKGIETTMVVHDDRIWKRVFTPAMSRFFEDYYAGRGVTFAKDSTVKQVSGGAAVESVLLSNGKTLACDLVVAGIGVAPVVDLFDHSGLEIENGIVVNEFLETSRPGIYAAGDVANYYDVLFGKHRRVEHWDNAVSQGEHCAGLLM